MTVVIGLSVWCLDCGHGAAHWWLRFTLLFCVSGILCGCVGRLNLVKRYTSRWDFDRAWISRSTIDAWHNTFIIAQIAGTRKLRLSHTSCWMAGCAVFFSAIVCKRVCFETTYSLWLMSLIHCLVRTRLVDGLKVELSEVVHAEEVLCWASSAVAACSIWSSWHNETMAFVSGQVRRNIVCERVGICKYKPMILRSWSPSAGQIGQLRVRNVR